jgi:hypothetical protein
VSKVAFEIVRAVLVIVRADLKSDIVLIESVRMIAMFLKMVYSVLRCRQSVTQADPQAEIQDK